MSKPHMVRHIIIFAIRPPMGQYFRHALKHCPIDLSRVVKMEQARDAAHIYVSVLRLRGIVADDHTANRPGVPAQANALPRLQDASIGRPSCFPLTSPIISAPYPVLEEVDVFMNGRRTRAELARGRHEITKIPRVS